jgi:hypothetical protein
MILLDVAKESSDWFPPLKSTLGGLSALIKHYEVPMLERVVATHNLHGYSQHSKDVKEKMEDLVSLLDRFKQNITTTTIDGDPEETERRRKLTRCVRKSLASAHPYQRSLQRIGKDREAIAGTAGKKHCGSIHRQGRGFRNGGETHRTTSRGHYPLSSKRELCCWSSPTDARNNSSRNNKRSTNISPISL